MPPRARARRVRRGSAGEKLVRADTDDPESPCLVCWDIPEEKSVVTCTNCLGTYKYCGKCISFTTDINSLKCLYCRHIVKYSPKLTLMAHREQREQEDYRQQPRSNRCANCVMYNRDNSGRRGFVPVNERGHNSRTCPLREAVVQEEGMCASLYIVYMTVCL